MINIEKAAFTFTMIKIIQFAKNNNNNKLNINYHKKLNIKYNIEK